MSDEVVFVKIVGEPFLSGARAYREGLHAAQAAWIEFAKAVGGELHERGGLRFPGEPPKDWRKPSGNGGCYPVKGTDAARVMAALPRTVPTRQIFGDALMYDVAYVGPDGSAGGGGIGHQFWNPEVGWIGDGEVYVAAIPHAANSAANHLAEYPEDEITNGADRWTVPEGLVEVSKEEKEAMYVSAALERERREDAG